LAKIKKNKDVSALQVRGTKSFHSFFAAKSRNEMKAFKCRLCKCLLSLTENDSMKIKKVEVFKNNATAFTIERR